MSEVRKRVKNAQSVVPKRKNVPVKTPSASEGLRDQYGFRRNTADFTQRNIKYGTDFFDARVQGIDENDFYKWYNVKIRMSQMVTHGTTTNIIEDWKEIKFESQRVNVIGLGAKVECNGQMWIVSYPDEANGTQATAIMRRCNATWKYLDFYGNVKEEPFFWARNQGQATANEYQDYMVTPNLYQKCVMQLNEDTKALNYNRRMILGSSAYEVRGLIDFLQSEIYAGDSTHILYFDLQNQEPIDTDDMERQLADAKAFSLEAQITGVPNKTVPGKSYTASVAAVRNGQILVRHDGKTWGIDEDGHEEPLGDYPMTWEYESSDDTLVSVDENGAVTVLAEGLAAITATLRENPEIKAMLTLEISAEGESKLEWVMTADRIAQYMSAPLECRWTVDGEMTEDEVQYEVRVMSGNRNAVEWHTDGNVITLTGYVPDKVEVIARAHGQESRRTVVIEGF